MVCGQLQHLSGSGTQAIETLSYLYSPKQPTVHVKDSPAPSNYRLRISINQLFYFAIKEGKG